MPLAALKREMLPSVISAGDQRRLGRRAVERQAVLRAGAAVRSTRLSGQDVAAQRRLNGAVGVVMYPVVLEPRVSIGGDFDPLVGGR